MRRGQHRRATSRRAASAALLAGMAIAAVPLGSRAATSPTPAPPSAIGDEGVFSIVVSPEYQRTGLVVATATSMAPGSNGGPELWATHDGGHSWAIVPARGWNHGPLAIGVDRGGHEAIFSGGSSSLQRSDDGGLTWSAIAAGGNATPTDTYASDGALAVANGTGDFVLKNNRRTTVSGSGGAASDLAFWYMPGSPSTGSFSPVLLAAQDAHSGAPVVYQCTEALRCPGPPNTLPGNTFTSSGMKLLGAGDYSSSGVVFALTGQGVYRSMDGAHSFVPLTVAASDGATQTAITGMALGPGYAETGPKRTAYVSVLKAYINKQQTHTAGGVYRTTDGGTSWSRLSEPRTLDYGATAVAVAPDGRVFAGYAGSTGQGGLLCSADGTTWQATCTSVRATRAGALPAGSGHGDCLQPTCAIASPGVGPTNDQGGNGNQSGSQAAVGSARADRLTAATPSSRSGLGAGLVAVAVAVVLLLAGLVRVMHARLRPKNRIPETTDGDGVEQHA